MPSAALVLVLSAAVCLVSCDPPARNDGRESGYYGDFNRVSNALVSIPGVTISNSWMNRDFTLEEFGFELVTGSGKVARIAVGERGPLRDLRGAKLVEALGMDIETQSR